MGSWLHLPAPRERWCDRHYFQAWNAIYCVTPFRWSNNSAASFATTSILACSDMIPRAIKRLFHQASIGDQSYRFMFKPGPADEAVAIDIAMLDKYVLPYIEIELPNRRIEVSKLYYERKYGDAPANTVVDLSFAAMLKDLGIPPLPQHDAFNDALMTAMMYVVLRDLKERGVCIARGRAMHTPRSFRSRKTTYIIAVISASLKASCWGSGGMPRSLSIAANERSTTVLAGASPYLRS